MVTAEEARRLGILDDERGVYIDRKKNSRMLIGDAVDLGLVEIEYDQEADGMLMFVYITEYDINH